MKAIRVGSVKLSAIKTVVRAKCESIKRSRLEDVNGNEIKVLQTFPNDVYICRIRGMTYKIDLNSNHPSLGTYDPVLVSSQRVPSRRGRSSLREEK